MKKIFNALLALCVAGLLFICWRSIQDDIDFQKEVTIRENAVKARLLQVRAAQEEFKLQSPDAAYCDSLWKLVEFVRTGRIPKIVKEGVLSDEQMESGLTEAKASAIVNSGDAAAIAANGLQGFRRDTTWVVLSDSLFGEGFNPDSLRYIPFAEGDTFHLEVYLTVTRSGTPQCVMECCAPDESFLKNMGRNGDRLIVNRRQLADDMGSYPGLKIGDLSNWNNNAGNWE
ncbi:MAG: hypothetical protein K6G70_01445 [Bacteroidaceae bacterium]|nr:hypothetical protein [Bacteroidaceae bacterium]